MAEEKLIQISLQLPVSELAGVTVLVEQMRQLLMTGNQTTTNANELERSTGFDNARFQELAQAAAAAEGDVDIPDSETVAENKFNTDTLKVDADKELDAKVLDAAVKNDINPEVPGTSIDSDIDVRSLRVSVEEGVTAPSTAGFTVSDNISSLLPERRRDAEQLIAAGPAPLTAEAVSLAFRRDDRRYDNGFPLY